MSNPSFSNIDMWLFELAEGNLSPDQIAKLELFLLQNPDLDVDRDVWEMAKVSAAPAVYPDQAGLTKRKPVGMYTLVGSSALLLLTLVGCLSYFTVTAPEIPQTAQVDKSEVALQKENHELKEEISDLKSIVTSLEAEISDSRGSALTGSESSGESGSVVSFGEPSGIVGSTATGTSSVVGGESGTVLAGTSSVPGSTIVEPGTSGLITSPALLTSTATGITTSVAPGNTGMLAGSSVPGLEAEKMVELISFKETKPLETSVESESRTESRRVPKDWTNTYNVNYNMSMKNRFSKWSRAIQRMMDNPVALKNSRDPHFHIPGMTTQDINFGSTGTLIAPRVQALSRLQWNGETNELFQNQLAVDGYSYAMRGGIGIQMNHAYYNNGGLQVSNAAITYSPKISFSRAVSIEPAFRFKMGNKLLNDGAMGDASLVEIDRGIVHNYYNDGSQPVGRSLWYKDLGIGLNVNTEWFFASAQVDNIFKHKDNIYTTDLNHPRRAGTHFVTTVGTDWESRKENHKGVPIMGLSTYMMYQKNEQLSEAWLGVNYRWRWLTVGGAISSKLDPVASVGIKLNHFSLQYNADYAYSIMNNKNALSHQVTLRIVGKPSRFGKRLLNL